MSMWTQDWARYLQQSLFPGVWSYHWSSLAKPALQVLTLNQLAAQTVAHFQALLPKWGGTMLIAVSNLWIICKWWHLRALLGVFLHQISCCVMCIAEITNRGHDITCEGSKSFNAVFFFFHPQVFLRNNLWRSWEDPTRWGWRRASCSRIFIIAKALGMRASSRSLLESPERSSGKTLSNWGERKSTDLFTVSRVYTLLNLTAFSLVCIYGDQVIRRHIHAFKTST